MLPTTLSSQDLADAIKRDVEQSLGEAAAAWPEADRLLIDRVIADVAALQLAAVLSPAGTEAEAQLRAELDIVKASLANLSVAAQSTVLNVVMGSAAEVLRRAVGFALAGM